MTWPPRSPYASIWTEDIKSPSALTVEPTAAEEELRQSDIGLLVKCKRIQNNHPQWSAQRLIGQKHYIQISTHLTAAKKKVQRTKEENDTANAKYNMPTAWLNYYKENAAHWKLLESNQSKFQQTRAICIDKLVRDDVEQKLIVADFDKTIDIIRSKYLIEEKEKEVHRPLKLYLADLLWNGNEQPTTKPYC